LADEQCWRGERWNQLAALWFFDYEAPVLLNITLGSLALLSFLLMLWQWVVARRFPLHQRVPPPPVLPTLTQLKPLKGADHATESCLWPSDQDQIATKVAQRLSQIVVWLGATDRQRFEMVLCRRFESVVVSQEFSVILQQVTQNDVGLAQLLAREVNCIFKKFFGIRGPALRK